MSRLARGPRRTPIVSRQLPSPRADSTCSAPPRGLGVVRPFQLFGVPPSDVRGQRRYGFFNPVPAPSRIAVATRSKLVEHPSMRALIVEDDHTIAAFLAKGLREAG